MDLRRWRRWRWAVLALGLGLGCSVQRVPLRDPATTSPHTPYDFEGEKAAPPAPAVEPAPSGARLDSDIVSLDTPEPVNLNTPSLQVQDLAALPRTPEVVPGTIPTATSATATTQPTEVRTVSPGATAPMSSAPQPGAGTGTATPTRPHGPSGRPSAAQEKRQKAHEPQAVAQPGEGQRR